MPAEEQDAWLLKSVAFAEECGASVIALIPARGGNGAMEALTAQRLFRAPTAEDVLRSYDFVLANYPSPKPLAPRLLLDPWAAHAH